MSATRWLKVAAIAALAYVLYDFIPSPLPDMSGDVHQIVVAALIVAAVYLAVAGVLALVGKGKVESATPPLPEQAIASSKQDVEEVKARAKEGRA